MDARSGLWLLTPLRGPSALSPALSLVSSFLLPPLSPPPASFLCSLPFSLPLPPSFPLLLLSPPLLSSLIHPPLSPYLQFSLRGERPGTQATILARSPQGFPGNRPNCCSRAPLHESPLPSLVPCECCSSGTSALEPPHLGVAPGGGKEAARPGEGCTGLALWPLGLALPGAVNPLEVWRSRLRGCQARLSHILCTFDLPRRLTHRHPRSSETPAHCFREGPCCQTP